MAKRDVELIIRAKNEASRSVDAVSKSLAELTERQEVLGSSAKKTDGLLGQLASEFDKLRTVSGGALALDKLRASAEQAGQAFARQTADLAKARAAQTDLARTYEMVQQANAETNATVERSSAVLKQETAAVAAAKARLQEYSAAQREAASASTAAAKALAKAQAEFAKEPTKANEVKLVDAGLQVNETRKAARQAVLAQSELSKAFAVQNTQLQANKAAHAQLAKGLADGQAAQSKLATEIARTDGAVRSQAAGLAVAEKEYAELGAVVQRAEQTFNQAAQAQGVLGQSSQQVAQQLTILRARMAELQALQRAPAPAKAVIDPAALRESNLGLREAMVTIRAVGTEAGRGSIGLRELGSAVEQVAGSAKQLTGLLGAIEKQEAAVAEAKRAWSAAQSEVQRLALALRSATNPSEQLVSAFGRAQGAARAAKDAFLQQTQAAESLGTGLRLAGLQHDTLADAQTKLKARLVSVGQALMQGRTALIGYSSTAGTAGQAGGRVAAGLRPISPAAKGAGDGIKALAKQLGLLDAEGRKSLSLMQRIRGQMLSIAAATGGVFAAQTAIASVVQAQLDMDAVASRFSVAFEGDQGRVKQAMEFTKQTADELGLSYRTLSLQYSKLAAASLGTNLEGEKTAVIFKSMAEAARVLRLTDDEVAGTFKALTDIMSKGTIQAEELKGQLGDRFPGAVQIMAKALGVGTAELLKMMEQGQLTSDSLYEFSQEMAKRVAPGKEESIKSAAAQFGRLNNAILDAQLAVAGSGFLDELARGAGNLAKAISSPEMQEGFRKLGRYLADGIEFMGVFVEHIDQVVDVLTAFVGLLGLRALVGLGVDLFAGAVKLREAITLIRTGLAGLTVASAAAGGGISGLLTVLGGAAAVAAPWLAVAAAVGAVAYAAYDAYEANQKLKAQIAANDTKGAAATKALAEKQAAFDKVREKAHGDLVRAQEKAILNGDKISEQTRRAIDSYTGASRAQDGYVRSISEVINMTNEEIDAYQEVLLARMRVVAATKVRALLNPDDENSAATVAAMVAEEKALARAVEDSAKEEERRRAAVNATSGAVKDLAEATVDAGAEADRLQERLAAVALMDFDNSVLALERVHQAKLAALTLSGADEQAILAETSSFENNRLNLIRDYAARQQELVQQDYERRKQILSNQKLDAQKHAEAMVKIEEQAAQSRRQIAQQEIQSVSSAREQALNRYMSALAKVADYDRRIADIRLQGEFQIADIRNGAMSDQAAYQARQAELTRLNGRIADEVAKGNFEVAEALAQRQLSLAQSLNQEIKDGETVVISKERAAANAIQGTETANENLIGILQKRREIERATAEEQKALYETLTATLEKLNTTLARISGATEVDIPLTVDELKARDEMQRAVDQMAGVAFEGRVGVPVTADTREYVAKFDTDVLSKDGSVVRVGVFMEDGAYKLKVNEIKGEQIVATARVEFSGTDLDAAVARAKEIVQGDFPRMQLAFDSAATFAEFQALSAEVQQQLSAASFVLTTEMEANTAKVDAVVAKLTSTVTKAPVQFNPNTTAADQARTNLAQPIIVPVVYVPSGQPTASRANGGIIKVPGFANGGSPGGLLRGPGTGTSDSMLARVSNREYIVRAMAVRKYGTDFMNQLNAGTINPDRLNAATGGATGAGDSMSLNLTINGRETGTLSGSRASVQNLVDSLHEIARQTGS